jgi:hypothetical protein
MKTPTLLALVCCLTTAAPAQTVNVPAGYCIEQWISGSPFSHISGLAPRADGTLFHSDAFSQVSRIDPTGVATVLHQGAPITGGWTDCILGDGSALLGDDVIGVAFTKSLTSNVSTARVYRVDVQTGALTELAGENPSTPLFQHPSGLEVSSGGAFGNFLYVGTTDWKWTPYSSTVHRMDTTTGTMSLFATIPANQRAVSDMAFDRSGDFGGDLFIADLVHLAPTATIWRVDPTGAVTVFLQDQNLTGGVSIAFGPGGNAFGTDMYVLNMGSPTAKVWRIRPDGTYSVFADGFPTSTPVATWQFFEGELSFSPDGATMYVGTNNTVWKLSVGANVQTYCTAEIDSAGCIPAIGFAGTCPGTSANTPFLVNASGVQNNKNGILMYGGSAASIPFAGGTRCIAPIRRTPVQNSGGNVGVVDCSGSFSFDMNALVQAGTSPLVLPGATVYTQYMYRDPQGSGGLGLSDAGQFTVLP